MMTSPTQALVERLKAAGPIIVKRGRTSPYIEIDESDYDAILAVLAAAPVAQSRADGTTGVGDLPPSVSNHVAPNGRESGQFDPRDHLKAWMRDKPIDANPTCVNCGGPHPYDTSIPSVLWNRVIRGHGLPDYLCLTCIVRAFAHAGVSFTAELCGDGFSGLPVEVRVNSESAQSAALLCDENNRLRVALNQALRYLKQYGPQGYERSKAFRSLETVADAVCSPVPPATIFQAPEGSEAALCTRTEPEADRVVPNGGDSGQSEAVDVSVLDGPLVVLASYVLGGWSQVVNTNLALLRAIADGSRLSPIAEVTVRRCHTEMTDSSHRNDAVPPATGYCAAGDHDVPRTQLVVGFCEMHQFDELNTALAVRSLLRASDCEGARGWCRCALLTVTLTARALHVIPCVPTTSRHRHDVINLR